VIRMAHGVVALSTFVALFGCSSTQAGWQKAAPLPEPRWFHASGAVHDGRVAVFGGYVLVGRNKSRKYGVGPYSIRIYDPIANKWNQGPEVPPYRYRHIYDVITDYLDGRPSTRVQKETIGHKIVPHEMPNGGSDNHSRIFWFSLDGPVFYDAPKAQWDQPPSAIFYQTGNRIEGPVPKYDRTGSATATGPDGRFYLVGGTGNPLVGPESTGRSKLLNSLEIYDPKTNTWSEAAPMQAARQDLAAAFGRDGKLYVFGGCSCTGTAIIDYDDPEVMRRALIEQLEQRRSVKITDAYDPKTNTWQTRAPMPEPRQMLAAARGADGKIYVIGGVLSYSGMEKKATVDVYDPATDTWSEGPELHMARHGHTAVSTPDGKIYVIGGSGPKGPTASVEVLDTAPKR